LTKNYIEKIDDKYYQIWIINFDSWNT
jgi:hypothetical protein